jgi:hypothetical protein
MHDQSGHIQRMCSSVQSAAVSFLHAEQLTGQLPSLAAAHPEAYTALIDCCLRMPVLPPDSMLVPARLLLHASAAILGSQAALDNTAAVAGLASALTSLAKRTVQFIRAAADLQAQPAAAATGEVDAAAAYFPAAVPYIADECVTQPACLSTGCFGGCETAAAGNANGRSSSSQQSQAAASAALLAVVFARSLVQLADAMEAAGPEVYLKSLLGGPAFSMRWVNGPNGATFSKVQICPVSREDQQNAEVQWHVWHVRVLQAMKQLWAAFKSVGIAPLAAAAGQPKAAAAANTSGGGGGGGGAAAAAIETLAGDACADPQDRSTSSSIGSTSNSNSSSAGRQVKWGYLLRLLQCSPQWAAAVAAYEANQPNWEEFTAVTRISTAAAEQHSQQYAAAISLCRALAAAAPLPVVVCNNPSCGNTEGVSEAAAASKACAGCRCRYCSVACQRADWKRHKGACRRMAAAGQACV